jgi:hypothetical protein
MRIRVLVLLAVAAAATAHAQRDAVSAALSPEAAGQAFQRAVTDVCIPAAAGNGVSALGGARQGALQPTQDPETRKQAGASVDETVWDVNAARGVVTVRERAGQCVVSVYGPSAGPTILATMRGLSGLGFEELAGPTASGFTQTLVGTSGGKRMTVQLSGAEPGAPGNRSKFSVVTAAVSLAH